MGDNKTYKIKPLQWKLLEDSNFIRLKSSAAGYYRYEIFKFLSSATNNWSDWRLDIKLDSNTFWPKGDQTISSAKYKTFEEAEGVANKHHFNFVEQFLTECSI